MRLLLFLLLLPLFAQAATTVDRYVDKDCANNGDGTVASPCASGAGATGPYNTLSNAEGDIGTDYANFVSSDVVVVLHLQPGANDTNTVIWDGMTMDATRYLRIVCEDGYKLVTGSATTTFEVRDTHVRVENCWFENTSTGNVFWIGPGAAGGDVRLINSKMIGGNTGYGFNNIGNSTAVYAINNFFSGNAAECTYFSNSGSSGQVHVLYNNTCYPATNTDDGFKFILYGSTDSGYVYNNVINNCAACYYYESGYTTYAHDRNITSDTDSPDASYRSLTCTFVDAANDDLHLDPSDTNCEGDGADLSGDGQYPFSTDIDGETRTGSWDIGADELTASTPTFSVFQAIGAL